MTGTANHKHLQLAPMHFDIIQLLPSEFESSKGHLEEAGLEHLLQFLLVTIPWKSLVTIFYRLLYEFHHFSRIRVIIQKEFHHVLNSGKDF